ncbi:hypothetical protein HMPREF9056_00778 [Actinomyces sp. oral taxon 170 str. F0386]|nr:hypothetical protein HMPREF9056_00778 [Actinomyces sp. oral taxon 170 str. F0386]
MHEPVSVKAPLIAAWTGRRDVGGIHGDNGAPFEGPVSDHRRTQHCVDNN